MTEGKPTAEELMKRLGVGVDALPWSTSGDGAGMFQVARLAGEDGAATWVLVRLEDDSDVQVYSWHEWECFLDGAKRGEFDDLL